MICMYTRAHGTVITFSVLSPVLKIEKTAPRSEGHTPYRNSDPYTALASHICIDSCSAAETNTLTVVCHTTPACHCQDGGSSAQRARPVRLHPACAHLTTRGRHAVQGQEQLGRCLHTISLGITREKPHANSNARLSPAPQGVVVV